MSSSSSSSSSSLAPPSSRASVRTGTGGPSAGTGSTGARLGHSVCTFWIGKRCYALDTALVGEVVNVEQATPVPLAPPAVMGIFNLRGTPVALVDLAAVLELPEGYAAKSTEQHTALVLKKGGVLGAAFIDRMEVVIPVGQGQFTPRQGDEHPVVQGFLEVDVRGGLVLTVLDAAALLQRFERLKYR